MKTYWDTSAAINAAINTAVYARLIKDEHVTRPHTFAEFFGRMTGAGVRWLDASGVQQELIFSPKDAAAWLEEFAKHLQMVELDGAETLAALKDAGGKGVMGRRIHDLLHVTAAEKAKADKIITRNTPDFQPLTKMVVEWP